MLVRIGNLVFSSADQPIMVVLSRQDLKAIKDNDGGDGIGVKHVSAPGKTKSKEIKNILCADDAQRVMFESVGPRKKTDKTFGATLRTVTEY